MTIERVTQSRWVRALCVGGVLFLAAAPAAAQTAGMVSFQGLIRLPNGDRLLNGTEVSLVFRIYDADTNGNVVDMDGDGTVENTPDEAGDGTDAIRVENLVSSNGLVSTKFGPVSPKAFAGCTPGASGCRWLEVTITEPLPVGVLSRIEMVTPPGAAEQVNKAGLGDSALASDTSGNVSIGTTTPAVSRLNVVGAGSALNLTGGGSDQMYVRHISYPGRFVFAGIHTDGYARLGAFDNPLNSGVNLILNDSGGNVGIGTVSPQSRLDIRDSGTGERTILRLDTVESLGNTAGRLDWAQAGSVSGRITNHYEGADQFGLGFYAHNGTSLVQRLRIRGNGNVGIGDGTPAELLHVGSGSGASGETIQIGAYSALGEVASSGATLLGSNVKPANTPTNGMVFMANQAAQLGGRAIRMEGGSGIQFHAIGTGAVAGSPFSSEVMRITESGKVGIGTTTPLRPAHIVAQGPAENVPLRLENTATTSPGDAVVLEMKASNPFPSPGAPQHGINFLDAAGGAVSQIGVYAGTANNKSSMRIRTSAADRLTIDENGNVGIGTASPIHKLNVGGSLTDATSVMIRAKADSTPWAGAFGGSDSTVMLGDFGGVAQIGGHNGVLNAWSNLSINSGGGNVGIGTQSPSAKLHVAGNIIADAGTCCTSDARFKKNVSTLSSSLTKLLSLRGVWFQWKDPARHGDEARRQMGMIAQEVEKVLPEWVIKDAKGYRYLNTTGFPALAVEAMREMKNENDALKAHVSDLEKRLVRLETALANNATAGPKPAKGE